MTTKIKDILITITLGIVFFITVYFFYFIGFRVTRNFNYTYFYKSKIEERVQPLEKRIEELEKLLQKNGN